VHKRKLFTCYHYTHSSNCLSTGTMIPIIAPNGNVSGSVMIVGVVVDGAGIAEAVCNGREILVVIHIIITTASGYIGDVVQMQNALKEHIMLCTQHNLRSESRKGY